MAYTVDFEKETEKMVDYYSNILKGVANLMDFKDEDMRSDMLEKNLVMEIGKAKLYHYKPLVTKLKRLPIPVLISYALVNKQYMLDLQQDRSMIKFFLEHGLDVYIIDWGYPTREDRYLTMEDHINWYLNDFVDFVREQSGHDKINLLGVCQGGTFSGIYTALHPEKINALVTMVAPFDFTTNDALLFAWSKYLDADSLVDAFGTVPGALLNVAYLLLKPFDLILDKYIGFGEKMDDPDYLKNFIRMERWINDSPDQAGETLRQFIKDCYQENKLAKGTLEMGGKKVDLKKITCPFLGVIAAKDHLVPAAASRPIMDLVGSKDKEFMEFPVGHIGMYTSSRSQKEIAPKIVEWLAPHSK